MRRVVVLAALVALVAGTGVTGSGADFTAASASPRNTFTAAADFNTVAVTLRDPGAVLRGGVTLAATASSDRGIARVRFQSSPAGSGTWTDACAAAATPFSCDWDTTAVADGVRDLRAIAVDEAGYQRTSAVVASRRVDNAPTVSLADPGTPMSGTVTLSATASGGSAIASVVVERSPAGAGSWTAVCTDASAPYSCAFDTTAVPEGSYDLRARATDNAGRVGTSAIVANRAVDYAPRGTDVQAINGGPTAGRMEPGDAIRFWFSEAVASGSILAGWTGAAQAIRVYVSNAAAADTMDFRNSAGTIRLNLVDSAADLPLDGNFVSAATIFNATISMSGVTATVTLGSLVSGTVRTANAGTMTWRPSSAILDLAGIPANTALVTESGAADRDF